jgi:hypothetical protein
VDGDLPVDNNGNLVYLQKAGGSIYAAILEKALAFARFRQGNYLSIEGGQPSSGLQILGGTQAAQENVTAYASNGKALLQQISDVLDTGNVMIFGTKKNLPAGLPLIGNHAYSVVKVNKDANGNPVSLVLRNPWGKDGAGNDANPNDGLVTLTASQAWAGLQSFGYAYV